MNLQNRLKEFRKENDLTQDTLAQMVGVTRQTIISIEQGKFVPSVKLALMLSHAIGKPLDEVFWIENT